MEANTDIETTIPVGTWAIDPSHSSVEFSVKHMGITTVRGVFNRFDGTLEISDDLASSRASGSVEVPSVDTNEPDRDAHLRSPDFFDVEKHPKMTFASTNRAGGRRGLSDRRRSDPARHHPRDDL